MPTRRPPTSRPSRSRCDDTTPARARVLALLLVLAGVVYAVVFAATFTLGLAAAKLAVTWTSLTFGHYWPDGLIWRMRNKHVARTLAVA